MLRNVLALFLTLVLCACAVESSPVPEGYKGDLANVGDSVHPYGSSKADIFYVSHIDGKKVKDSLIETRVRNHGHGFSMNPAVVDRLVPTQPTVFKIAGRTEYAAPILALTSTIYQVSGEVSFTPEADKTYVVSGELGENYSAVWIEEASSKTMMDKKIEIKGSAKLCIFEK